MDTAKQVHLEFQCFVVGDYAVAVLHEDTSGIGKGDFVAHTFEQPHPVGRFQFLDVLCYGGLAHKQFMGSSSEAKVAGHRCKHFQAEIGHDECGLYYECYFLEIELVGVALVVGKSNATFRSHVDNAPYYLRSVGECKRVECTVTAEERIEIACVKVGALGVVDVVEQHFASLSNAGAHTVEDFLGVGFRADDVGE